jgi:nicotinate-nucleotide adenylyltransferase
MKIGLFFGSFNPIHNGHLIIANLIIQFTDIEKIWFVISPQNPHKNKKKLLKENERLNLVNLAIEDNPKFKASAIEFKLPKPSYTIDTLVHIKEKYPKNQFCLIMGEDNLDQLHNWKNGDIILRDYEIYCYKRKATTNFNFKGKEYIKIIDFPYLDISATYIRSLIKDKKSARYLLPDKVYNYITDYNLYK